MRKKPVVICLSVLLAVIVALAIVFIALYFTVFRQRSPRVAATVLSSRISGVDLIPGQFSFNLSYDVGMTVSNPNYAAFRYGEVLTAVTYHGKPVGESTTPAGGIGARTTETVVATVVVDAAKVVQAPQFFFEMLGVLPFEATTVVNGKAVMLDTFKIKATSVITCSVSTNLLEGESSMSCTSVVGWALSEFGSGCYIAVVLLVVVTFVALYLTVLCPRPPRVVATVVYTRLSAFGVLLPSLNLSLAVHVTLHNPCQAPFRYARVTTAVTYRGAPVGRSAAPEGKIPARTTRTVAAWVQVDAARVVLDRHYVLDAVTGALLFEAATAVAGRKAAALRPLEVTADAEVACSVILYPFKRESSSRCTSTVRVTGI